MVRTKIFLYLVLAFAFVLVPFAPNPATQTTQTSTYVPVLPNLPRPNAYHDFWYCFGAWLTSFQKHFINSIGSFTQPIGFVSAYQTIAYNTASGTTGTGTGETLTITTLPANSLVMISISTDGTTALSNGFPTVGGSAATAVTTRVSQSTNISDDLYYNFSAGGGSNVAVVVQYDISIRHAWSYSVYTGTKSSSIFEDTTTGNNTGSSAQTVSPTQTAAGTTGRWVFQSSACETAAGGSHTGTIAVTSSQTLRDQSRGLAKAVSTDGVSEGESDTNGANSAAITMADTCTLASNTLQWATIATAILPNPVVSQSIGPEPDNLVDVFLKTSTPSIPKDSSTLSDVLTRLRNVPTGVADTLHLNDVFTHAVGKILADVLVLSDKLAKGSGVTLTNSRGESLNLTDLISKATGTKLSDTLIIADALQAAYTPAAGGSFLQICARTFLQSLAIAESLLGIHGQFASVLEAFNLVDIFQLGSGKPLTDILALIDSIAAQYTPKSGQNYPRSLVDVLTLLASLLKGSGTTLTGVLNVTDLLTKLQPRSLTDTLILADSMLTGRGKPLPETLLISDSVLKNTGKPFTDPLTLTDAITRLRNVPKTLADALALSDSLLKGNLKPLTDTLTISDSIIRLRNVPNSLTDILSIADSIKLGNGKPIAEALTLIDTLTKTQPRSLTDTLKITDAVLTGKGKPLTDSLTLVDVLLKGSKPSMPINALVLSDTFTHSIGKPFTDTLNLTDSLSRLYKGSASLADVLTLTDSLAHTIGKPLADTLLLSDTLTRLFIGKRALTETLTLTDVLSHLIGKPATDTLILVDSFNRTYLGKRTNTENLNLTDTFTHIIGKPLTDTLNLTDLILRAGVFSRSTGTNTLSLLDSLTKGSGTTSANTLTLTDNLSRVYTGFLTFLDSLTLIDVVSTGTQNPRSLTDILILTEHVGSLYGAQRASTEPLSLIDLLHFTAGKTASDTLTIKDTLRFLRNIPTSLADALTLTETVTSQLSALRNLTDILILTDNLTAIYHAGGAPQTINISLSDLFNVNDLISKLLTPTQFGVVGGQGQLLASLVQIQLTTTPRIATLDYVATNPISAQQFLFTPTSVIEVFLMASNGNRNSQTINLILEVKRNNQPYLATTPRQVVLQSGVPTNLQAFLPITEPGTYEIIPHASAVPADPQFQAVTLPTQTVTVDIWQIWLMTIILWAPILLAVSAIIFTTVRSIQTRRKEIKEAAENPPTE